MVGGDSAHDDNPREEVTLWLGQAAAGDRSAKNRLFQVLYDELREAARVSMSQENPGHTLQATALVNEAWLRLIDQDRTAATNRGHFLALAAQAMRRILIDHARTRGRQRRGGAWRRVELEAAEGVANAERGYEDLLAIDHALERLRAKSERMARMVELRFFGGLSVEETAEAMGVSVSTVVREWRVARALMTRLMGENEESAD